MNNSILNADGTIDYVPDAAMISLEITLADKEEQIANLKTKIKRRLEEIETAEARLQILLQEQERLQSAMKAII